MKRSVGTSGLAFPAPVWVIGTYNKEGKPNAMTASWAGICCSSPVCVAVALRKATYTYASLLERKAFTVSIPSEAHLREADYFGIATGASTDKFAASGLTPTRSTVVDAPYVEEFPLVLECRLLRHIELGLHTQFIGEVLEVKAEESVLGPSGLPEISKVRPFIFAPDSHVYWGLGARLGEAFAVGRKH